MPGAEIQRWTDTEKVAILFQIIALSNPKIPWTSLQLPPGRTLKAVQLMYFKEKTRVEAAGGMVNAPKRTAKKARATSSKIKAEKNGIIEQEKNGIMKQKQSEVIKQEEDDIDMADDHSPTPPPAKTHKSKGKTTAASKRDSRVPHRFSPIADVIDPDYDELDTIGITH